MIVSADTFNLDEDHQNMISGQGWFWDEWTHTRINLHNKQDFRMQNSRKEEE